MPRNKVSEFKVGIFVAVGLGILALFIVSLTGLGFGGGEDAYRVRFRNVAGLENGSIVALGGLKVGRVESVGIAPGDKAMMEAYIRVKKGTPIRKNSKVGVTSVGITGSMFLSISLGTPDAPLLKPGAIIRGTEAASFQEVINKASRTATEVNEILGTLGTTINEVAADTMATIKDVRGQVHRVLASADRVMRRVENVLSKRNERNINRFLTSVARVADRLDKNIDPIVSELQLTLKKARGSLAQVDRTAKSYASLAGNASTFVDDLRARLSAVDRVLARMEGLGGELEKMFAQGDVSIEKIRQAFETEIHGIRTDLQKEIASTGATLRREISGVGGQARSTLRKGGQNLASTLKAIEGVSNRIKEFFDANQNELREMIANFNSASKQVDKILTELSGGPEGEAIRGAAEELRLAIRRAHSLLAQLDDLVASHREDVDLLITDLRDTANNLNEFTTTLREQPAAVIFKSPASPREFAK